jgi:RsiW-degrading membrane proteinase PrsW (M82 family)
MELAILITLSAIPTAIWAYLIFEGRKTSRWPLALAFLLGTLTVLPLVGLEYFWVLEPEFDIYNLMRERIQESLLFSVVTLLVAAFLEEFFKSGVVRFIDKTRVSIQTIGDAINYSVLAGLGFSFIENIVYFYSIYSATGIGGLIFPLIFRSIFTMCAHMTFSGIFGYFYGLSKFAKPIVETKLFKGERQSLVRLYSKFAGVDEPNAFSQLTLVRGLFVATTLHMGFNLALEYEKFVPVMLIVGLGFAYLLYLLAHRAGAITFHTQGRLSTLPTKDTDVVLQLLGMWSREGRHKDVMDICQRLLMRDPDNHVVQLFLAEAMDHQKLANLEQSFFSLFDPTHSKHEEPSLRALVQQKILMEMFKDSQAAPPQTSPSSPTNNPANPPAASTPAVAQTEPESLLARALNAEALPGENTADSSKSS